MKIAFLVVTTTARPISKTRTSMTGPLFTICYKAGVVTQGYVRRPWGCHLPSLMAGAGEACTWQLPLLCI